MADASPRSGEMADVVQVPAPFDSKSSPARKTLGRRSFAPCCRKQSSRSSYESPPHDGTKTFAIGTQPTKCTTSWPRRDTMPIDKGATTPLGAASQVVGKGRDALVRPAGCMRRRTGRSRSGRTNGGRFGSSNRTIRTGDPLLRFQSHSSATTAPTGHCACGPRTGPHHGRRHHTGGSRAAG